MAKSYDDPGPRDPVELARLEREKNEVARERSVRRTHPGAQPTDPPIGEDPSWPPKPVPGVGSPSVPAHGPSFGRGFYHLGAASSGISKRLAVLLGLVGTLLSMVAGAFGYWVTTNAVSLNRYAKDEADRKDVDTAIRRENESLRITVNDLRVKIAALETATRLMQQDPILPEKKRR